MNIFLEMFFSFFKIGAFTLGGGYAMLPLIQKEVVERRKWISKEEFLDMIAVAQSAPGPIAINTAVFVGYKLKGFMGAVFTTLGSVLPSFLIILIIASFFTGIQRNPVVERIFEGIRPAVVALIAAPVLNMGRDAKVNKRTAVIPVLIALVVGFLKFNPILVIIIAALGGIVIYVIKEKHDERPDK